MSTPDGPDVPVEEREALVEVASGAVVTSGGILTQRGLVTALEYVLAIGLGPLVYGVYALAWRISQLAFRLVNFGATPTLQRHIPAARNDSPRQRRIAGLAYATTAGLGVVAAAFAAGAGPLVATVGTAIGLATYAIVLRHLGIDPRDRLVVSELTARYKRAIRDWIGVPRPD